MMLRLRLKRSRLFMRFRFVQCVFGAGCCRPGANHPGDRLQAQFEFGEQYLLGVFYQKASSQLPG